MTASAPNPYLRTKVMTASPEELRLMLLDGSIKFLSQAIDSLERQDPEAAFNAFTRCQDIVMELLTALRPEEAPELCQKLSGLYTFMYTRLVKSCVERDVQTAREVLQLLEFERETWTMLMARQASGTPTPPAEAGDAGSAARLSVEG